MSHGLHFSQTKYTLDILYYSSMLECKPCSITLSAKSQLSINSTIPLADVIEYRHLVGFCSASLSLVRIFHMMSIMYHSL